MADTGFLPSLTALRRKLRALGAIAGDPGATPPERANAKVLKEKLEQRLRKAGAPAGDWSDHAFRLGRWAKQVHNPGSSGLGENDWPDQARRLGKAVGRSYRKWFPD
jgi:hypothetical protein